MSDNNKTGAAAKTTLQDRFLEKLRLSKGKCVLFTINGVQVHGFIRSYDNFTVLIEDPDKHRQSLVYKHAISTISPNEFIRFDEE